MHAVGAARCSQPLEAAPTRTPLGSTRHCRVLISAPKPWKNRGWAQSLPRFHIPFIFPLQQLEREPDKPRRSQSFWKRRADHLLLSEDFAIVMSFVLQRLLLHLDCRVYKGINQQYSWQEREAWVAAFLWTSCLPSAPSLTLLAILNPFGEWEVALVNNSCPCGALKMKHKVLTDQIWEQLDGFG